jgi:hypothetical protein
VSPCRKTSDAADDLPGVACLLAKAAGPLSLVLWHDMQDSAVGSNEQEATAEGWR